MSRNFDPDALSVIVPVLAIGPRRTQELACTVDTGATRTVLPAIILRALGYDLARPQSWTRIRSATGVVRVPVIAMTAVSAFGRVRTNFLVAAHDFPLGTTAEGLLGLDFFRELVLTLDFARGRISLGPPRPWWRFW
jgi:predicted aspartyl protease